LKPEHAKKSVSVHIINTAFRLAHGYMRGARTDVWSRDVNKVSRLKDKDNDKDRGCKNKDKDQGLEFENLNQGLST